MQTSQLFTSLQQRQQQRDYRYLKGLVIILFLALIVSLCAGDTWIWPRQWFSERGQLFVWQLRLPRSLAVMMVGASLAV
ncbi:MAG: iron chelate uptake ABC transporter family permease subunit, partial [Yersinia sp. (in: enterobacteria)]